MKLLKWLCGGKKGKTDEAEEADEAEEELMMDVATLKVH